MKKDKLHNMKSTGFKTPDNYFESFEAKFFERLDKKEAIDGVESHGYKVPENYFESIEASIFNKLNTRDQPVINLKSRKIFYYMAGIAASIVLLVSIFFNSSTTEVTLSVEMVETYLETRDLDSYELAQLLSEVDLLDEDFIITQTTYNEDNLETYLLDNADIETMLDY